MSELKNFYIGLTGETGHGKSTTASYLVSKYTNTVEYEFFKNLSSSNLSQVCYLA